MNIRIILLAITVVSMSFLVSCDQEKKKEKEQEKYDEQSETIFSERAEVLFSQMLKPAETPYGVMLIGVDFDQELINDPFNYEAYRTSPERAAVNLGIYINDLAYTMAYNDSASSRQIYDAANSLAEFIGEGRVFNQAVLNSFGDQIPDSLEREYLNKAIMDARVKLKEKNRTKLGTLILAGMYIERLYQLTSIIERYPTDLPEENRKNILAPLMVSVYKQKEPLAKLVEYIDEVIPNPNHPEIVDLLRKLSEDFNNLGTIWETGDADIQTIIDDIDYQKIEEDVARIRNDLTSTIR